MTKITWRDKAAPIIASVIEANRDKPMKEIKSALRAAYPFGERAMFPYKVWCDEVRSQLAPLLQPVQEVNEAELPLFTANHPVVKP